MTGKKSNQTEMVARLAALAARLEGEGQYNIAKLTRAAAESLVRRGGREIQIPVQKGLLSDEIARTAEALGELGVEEALLAGLRSGAAAVAEGRLTMIGETPHPYVCRTCGHVEMAPPVEQCPDCGAWATTYQRFLPVYWLDALDPFGALERLRETPKDVEKLLAGLTEESLNQPPAEGGWAIRNILSHLRDAQGLLDFRLGLMLEQENPPLESKAVFEWAMKEEGRPPTTLEIFATYQASRRETLACLEGIPLRDWWRTGRHEEFGSVTIRQQASYFATHEITHLPQIAALRGTASGR